MYYTKGIDITNDKSMFNFLKNHFTYNTLNGWSGLKSIANNVKIYNLKLEGSYWKALSLLRADEYFEIHILIEDWEYEHPGYKVGFNGRSDGYLVLYNEKDHDNILPGFITDCEDYEDYKQWCKDYQGSVRDNRCELKDYTKLVQEFDILCDNLREYVNYLSTQSINKIQLPKVVDEFNDEYASDLEILCLDPIELSEDGESIKVGKILKIRSLTEALFKIMNSSEQGYQIVISKDSVSYRSK